MIYMPRSPRFHDPGAVYHVMARGNGGQAIVNGAAEYARLLSVFARVRESSDFNLYAYCVMPNHFHALIRVNTDPLSNFMHRIQSSWAKRFNLTHNRQGHVFQQRFKSKHCRDDTNYCRWLLRYIHVNPVNAGLTKRPEEWPWSSYRQFLSAGPGIAEIEWPLSLFDGEVSSFSRFVLQGIGELTEPEVMDDSTAECAVETVSFRSDKANFEALARTVANRSGIELDSILSGYRGLRVSAARRELAVRAIRAGMRPHEVALRLFVTRAAVSKMLRGPAS